MHGTRTSRTARSAHHAALGRAIRELRGRRALSQEELGFRAGLHRNHVGALERGELNPTFGTLVRILDGLEAPLTQLASTYERRRREVGS